MYHYTTVAGSSGHYYYKTFDIDFFIFTKCYYMVIAYTIKR